MSTVPGAVREEVRRAYAAAAVEAAEGRESSCGGGSCCDGGGETISFGSGLYDAEQRDEVPDGAALASLGCGNPTAVADLREGETVLDLGSGGGIDVILSARRVGPTGVAFGLDMTDEMLALARRNAAEAGVSNAIFLRGVIEDVPLPADSVDVVISNCVVNLSDDKEAVLREVARVLKPGGRLRISDVVSENGLSPEERAERGGWAGCIAGALSQREYEDGLRAAGFGHVSVEFTHALADGLHGAIVRAVKGATSPTRALPEVARRWARRAIRASPSPRRSSAGITPAANSNAPAASSRSSAPRRTNVAPATTCPLAILTEVPEVVVDHSHGADSALELQAERGRGGVAVIHLQPDVEPAVPAAAHLDLADSDARVDGDERLARHRHDELADADRRAHRERALVLFALQLEPGEVDTEAADPQRVLVADVGQVRRGIAPLAHAAVDEVQVQRRHRRSHQRERDAGSDEEGGVAASREEGEREADENEERPDGDLRRHRDGVDRREQPHEASDREQAAENRSGRGRAARRRRRRLAQLAHRRVPRRSSATPRTISAIGQM
jgi:arsenite methyltransferase